MNIMSFRYVPIFDIKLLVDNKVHNDIHNIKLLDRQILFDIFRYNTINNILYYGCGSGIIGIILLKYNYKLKINFIDINENSILNTIKNIKLNNFDVKQHKFTINRYKMDSIKYQNYDTLFSNPPQMPGSTYLKNQRPDKYGGKYGLLFYKTIIENLNINIKNILFFQTSMSSFKDLDILLNKKGFCVHTIKIIRREMYIDDIDKLQPYMFLYLLKIRNKKKVIFI